MRRIVCSALAFALLATAPVALGQATDPVAAAALFKEGREAAKRGDYKAACPKLADSYRLDPALGTLINLADCETHTGQIASAWQHFQEAADKLPSTDKRLPKVKEQIAGLEPRLPRLTIELKAGAPGGTKVTRDGVEVGSGSFGTALPMNPGEHTVVVTAPDRKERRFEVTLSEGKTERLEVEPGEALPAKLKPEASAGTEPPPPPPPPKGGSALKTAGFIVGGVGLAGLGVAAVTSIVLVGNNSTIEEHCGKVVEGACDAEGFASVESSRTLLPINTIFWIAGGVMTAAGVTLIVLSPRGEAKSAQAVRVTASPGNAAVSIVGRF